MTQRTFVAIGAAVALLLMCTVAGHAQNLPSVSMPSIKIPESTQAPRINGDLSDPAWAHAAKVNLDYNLRSHTAADVPTTAYIMTDGRFLYVAFDAHQRGPIHATQHTNDVGFGTDDQVAIYLWPNGADGFSYSFYSTPIGTHYQFSSENTAYDPTWWSAGRVVRGGYTVTMKIPLAVMRGGDSKPWRVEFARQNPHTLDDFVWAYGDVEQQGWGGLGFVDTQFMQPDATRTARG